jgi:hypothetical protein
MHQRHNSLEFTFLYSKLQNKTVNTDTGYRLHNGSAKVTSTVFSLSQYIAIAVRFKVRLLYLRELGLLLSTQ